MFFLSNVIKYIDHRCAHYHKLRFQRKQKHVFSCFFSVFNYISTINVEHFRLVFYQSWTLTEIFRMNTSTIILKILITTFYTENLRIEISLYKIHSYSSISIHFYKWICHWMIKKKPSLVFCLSRLFLVIAQTSLSQ